MPYDQTTEKEIQMGLIDYDFCDTSYETELTFA